MEIIKEGFEASKVKKASDLSMADSMEHSEKNDETLVESIAEKFHHHEHYSSSSSSDCDSDKGKPSSSTSVKDKNSRLFTTNPNRLAQTTPCYRE